MPTTKAILLLPLLAVQLVLAAESTCPSDMTEVFSTSALPWCVKKYDSAKSFCDAVKTCHENGQEMVSKPVFDAMKASSSIPGNGQWWVGLVDALNERGSTRVTSGWVWIMDGQVTNGAESYFESGEPNDKYYQDCVTTIGSKLLRDAACAEVNPFYCYSDPTAAARVNARPDHGKFELVEILTRQQPDPGCWIHEPSAITRVSCTLACLQYQFGDCFGFYWHPARQQCALLRYFDASLPLDATEFSATYLEMMQWTKYRRTEW